MVEILFIMVAAILIALFFTMRTVSSANSTNSALSVIVGRSLINIMNSSGTPVFTVLTSDSLSLIFVSWTLLVR